MRRFSFLFAFTAGSLALLTPASSHACSPMFSEGFAPPESTIAAPALPTLIVKVETFVAGMPALSPGDSCEGTVILAISVEMPGVSRRALKRMGFEIRQVSGTAAPGLMPDYALIPRKLGGQYSIYYAWTGLPRDPDGHVRWNLEVVAVTRDGRRSAPVPLRVASDGS
jgi:hypothetical protein